MNDITPHLAARLKREREARGWSIGDLAARSGVSRAMISKIERGESSPTAQLLGRLSGALELTISTLLAMPDEAAHRVSTRNDQVCWQDPASGYVRRALSPRPGGPLELVEGHLPPRTRIDYPARSYAFLHHQIWVIAGTLTFHEGALTHVLAAGSCLELGAPADCAYENAGPEPCRYLVAIARR